MFETAKTSGAVYDGATPPANVKRVRDGAHDHSPDAVFDPEVADFTLN